MLFADWKRAHMCTENHCVFWEDTGRERMQGNTHLTLATTLTPLPQRRGLPQSLHHPPERDVLG
jgi:hypothetical protein